MLLESGVPPPLGSIIPLLRSTGDPLFVFVAGNGMLQPAPLQGNIFIDPQNVSGNAGTGPGFGTSAAQPLPSYKALVQLWGTTSPFITQPTLITFISSHTDGSDPVVLDAICGAGGSIAITTTVATVTLGVVLAATVPKNRAAGANTSLQTNLGATAAVGQLVVNTTHASVSWANFALGGNAFEMVQPLVAAAVPPALQTTTPAEVDTWANGDTVNLLLPQSVNIAQFTCAMVSWNATRTNPGTLYRVVVFSPQGAGKDDVILGTNVLATECLFQKTVIVPASGAGNAFTVGAGGGPFGFPTFINCEFFGGSFVNEGFRFLGGGMQGFNNFVAPSNTANGSIDADAILRSTVVVASGTLSIGFVFLATGIENTIAIGRAAALVCQNGLYAGHQIYGTAGSNIQVNGNGRFSISGTFTAVCTHPVAIATGIAFGVSHVASSHTGASPDVINNGIATTVANLDAAAGVAGFGGTAFVLGGGTVTNIP